VVKTTGLFALASGSPPSQAASAADSDVVFKL